MSRPQLNPHTPARYDTAQVDLASVDGVLSTTRSVRLRLDCERPLDNQLITDCIDIAEQGPGGGNQSSRRWLVVRDRAQRQALADLYHATVGAFMTQGRDATASTAHPMQGVMDHPMSGVMKSAAHLATHLADVPAIVIPCIWGLHDTSGKPGLFDSILQSAWSFCLAARARGLATAWTTAILSNETELAELMGIPAGVTPVAMLPVAWAKGTEFGAVARRRSPEITYYDHWGHTYEARDERAERTMSEGPGATVEIDIDASPQRVWELVSDINIGAQFSEEFVRAEWIESGEDDSGVNSDRDDSTIDVGSQFIGYNQHPAIGEWSLTLTVTEYEPNVVFGWASGDNEDTAGARWRWEIDRLHGQRSRLRHTVRLGPGSSGLNVAIKAMPGKEPRIIHRRQNEHLTNMTLCVQGIKALAEASDRS